LLSKAAASVFQASEGVEHPLVKKLVDEIPIVFDNDGSSIKHFWAKLVLKKGAIPVFMRAYTIPFAMREMVSNALDQGCFSFATIVDHGRLWLLVGAFHSQLWLTILNYAKMTSLAWFW